MSELIGKSQILEADDLEHEDVPVPEWGGTVRVRALTGAERDSYEMRMAVARQKGDTDVDIRASLVGRCMIDENGERLFTNRELPQLARKSGAVLDRVFDVVARLSGISSEADDDATGKSEATSGGGSPTD